jgi:DNA-directed RNA polymerase subunit omega
MDPDLCYQALKNIPNPNVLVNIISKRCKQLTAPGPSSRPMVKDARNMSSEDIALREVIEKKLTWNLDDEPDKEVVKSLML